MSLLSDQDEWKSSLADSLGPWCLVCLDYFENLDISEKRMLGPIEMHHPIGKTTGRAIRRQFERFLIPLGWTAPVHQKCHYKLSGHAEYAAYKIHLATQLDNVDDRLNISTKHHLSGHYAFPASVLSDTIEKHFQGQFDFSQTSLSTLLQRLISSSTGLKSFRPSPQCAQDIRKIIGPQSVTPTFLSLASHYATRAEFDESKKLYDAAMEQLKDVRDSNRDSVYASSVLRKTQFHSDATLAKLAVQTASAYVGVGTYPYYTAVGHYGWRLLAENKRDAIGQFDLILDNVNHVPWLYIAEALLGKACCGLRWHESKQLIYVWLVQSQFICVFLGLHGWSHFGIDQNLRMPSDRYVGAGDILTSDVLRDIGREERIKLRQVAIGSKRDTNWLYQTLLETLTGEGLQDRSRVTYLQHKLPVG